MLHLRVEGRHARIILSRRETRNAIDVEGWHELAELAQSAAKRGAGALIISSLPGSMFSAGADMREFGRFRDDEQARVDFLAALRTGIDSIADLPIPTIALIEGGCYGGAVALAMACDIRVAAPGARFAITPAKLGIGYPQEDVHRLVGLVGPGQAARLLFTGAELDAADALRIGLVEVHDSDAAATAEAMADMIAGHEPESVATLKRSIRLAAAGIARDGAQDRAFLDLLGSPALAAKLAGRGL